MPTVLPNILRRPKMATSARRLYRRRSIPANAWIVEVNLECVRGWSVWIKEWVCTVCECNGNVVISEMKFRLCGDQDCPDWILAQIYKMADVRHVREAQPSFCLLSFTFRRVVNLLMVFWRKDVARFLSSVLSWWWNASNLKTICKNFNRGPCVIESEKVEVKRYFKRIFCDTRKELLYLTNILMKPHMWTF